MKFWTNYIVTKPEVDDSDLPLPEHRIFDDEGGIRASVEAKVKSLFQQVRASAHKMSPTNIKKRAALLRLAGARWTRRPTPVLPLEEISEEEREEAVKATPAKSPAKSPARKTVSPVKKAASVPRASTGRAAAVSPSPQKRKASVSPRRTSSPSRGRSQSKKSSPARASSPSPAPATRASPTARTRSPSPAKAKATPKKKSVRSARSTSRRASAKRSRSRSASKSRRSPAKKRSAPASSNPSPAWTLAALKEYAKEKSVKVGSLRNKTDILAAINNAN